MDPMKRCRRMKLLILILLTVAVIWLWGDFIYSRIVAAHLRKWEAGIKRDSDGVRNGCREYTIGEGDIALLLIHGINDSPRIYDKMAPVFAKHGFKCRVMRLPGYATPTRDYAKSTKEQWIRAVAEELAELRKEHEKVCIVAHSLGGVIAINHLLDHPQAADKIILFAPGNAVSNERSFLLSPRTWHEIVSRLFVFTWCTKSPFENDIHDPDEQDYDWGTQFTPLTLIDEAFGLIDVIKKRGSEFSTPMMMVLSKEDKIIDWQAAKRFYDGAKSNEKSLHFMEDAGHVIPIDNGWREVTIETIEFIRQ